MKHHSLKKYGRVEVQPHSILISVKENSQLQTLGRVPSSHQTGNWVDPTVSVDQKDLCPCQEFKPDSFVLQYVAQSLYGVVLTPLFSPKIFKVQSCKSTIVVTLLHCTAAREAPTFTKMYVHMDTLLYLTTMKSIPLKKLKFTIQLSPSQH